MSADNGIYILETSIPSKQQTQLFKKRYRVAHMQAIDDLEYLIKTQPYNIGAYLYYYWNRSPIFNTHDEAFVYAKKMAQCYPLLEYGIQDINLDDYGSEYNNFIFFGDL